MLKRASLAIALIICLSSCVHRESVQFDTPTRDPLPQPEWTEKDGMYCVTEKGAREILTREVLRNAYEEKLRATIEGCNKALK